MARMMGIDYGEKRIGIAITDEGSEMAFPYAVLENNPKVFGVIRNICNDQKVDHIIIGLPLDLQSRETEMTKKARIFGQRLYEESGIQINFHNEMLSTKEAIHIQGRHKKIDASAAALILDSYMKKNAQ